MNAIMRAMKPQIKQKVLRIGVGIAISALFYYVVTVLNNRLSIPLPGYTVGSGDPYKIGFVLIFLSLWYMTLRFYTGTNKWLLLKFVLSLPVLAIVAFMLSFEWFIS